MKLYNLKYSDKLEAIADLYLKGAIDNEENSTNIIAALQWSPNPIIAQAEYDEQGNITQEVIIEEGCFVTIIAKTIIPFKVENINTNPTTIFSGFTETEIDTRAELEADILMGKKVIKEFSYDNRLLTNKLTTEQTVSIAQAFVYIKMIGEEGSLTVLRDLVMQIPIQLLSTERRDKYVTMLDEYQQSK